MFKNGSSNNVRTDVSLVQTIIGESVVIEGKIKSDTSIQVEGKVYGDIETQGNVIVSEKGLVQANISGNEVTIIGKVNGNVFGKERINIKANGRLIGETKTKSFVIDEGGTFVGKSNMDVHGSDFEENKKNSHVKQDIVLEKEVANI